jgi:hypothetical protein
MDLATRLLERLALAGNGIVWVFWLNATSWKLVVVSCSWHVRDCRREFLAHVMHTLLDMNDADLAVFGDEATDRGALFVIDTLCRRSQSECAHVDLRSVYN